MTVSNYFKTLVFLTLLATGCGEDQGPPPAEKNGRQDPQTKEEKEVKRQEIEIWHDGKKYKSKQVMLKELDKEQSKKLLDLISDIEQISENISFQATLHQDKRLLLNINLVSSWLEEILARLKPSEDLGIYYQDINNREGIIRPLKSFLTALRSIDKYITYENKGFAYERIAQLYTRELPDLYKSLKLELPDLNIDKFKALHQLCEYFQESKAVAYKLAFKLRTIRSQFEIEFGRYITKKMGEKADKYKEIHGFYMQPRLRLSDRIFSSPYLEKSIPQKIIDLKKHVFNKYSAAENQKIQTGFQDLEQQAKLIKDKFEKFNYLLIKAEDLWSADIKQAYLKKEKEIHALLDKFEKSLKKLVNQKD